MTQRPIDLEVPTMSHLPRIQERVKGAELDGFLITDLANIRWLTGFTGTFGQVLVTPTDAIFLTDSRYTLQAKEQVGNMRVASFGAPKRALDLLEEQLGGIRRLGFEAQQVVVDSYQKWQERFTSIELVPVKDLVGPVRAVKTPEEVDRIRRGCAITDACYEHLMTKIRPGVTEIELRNEVVAFFESKGSVPGFPAIVVSGERSARPHGMPSDKPLAEGDFVTIDIGAQVEGYTADLTRTVVVGRASERQREVYDQVLKAQVEACSLLRNGANGKDIDLRVREILDEKGLAQYFGHGLGHGLGALVHDAGRLTMHEDQPIETGQVWTIEPGVYIDGLGGVRIEDDVLVTQGEPEILSHFPKHLIEVGV
jgi:Xaa-Pro aminopeptidase